MLLLLGYKTLTPRVLLIKDYLKHLHPDSIWPAFCATLNYVIMNIGPATPADQGRNVRFARRAKFRPPSWKNFSPPPTPSNFMQNLSPNFLSWHSKLIHYKTKNKGYQKPVETGAE